MVRLPPIGYRWRKFGEEKGLFKGPRTSGRKHGRLGREGKERVIKKGRSVVRRRHPTHGHIKPAS